MPADLQGVIPGPASLVYRAARAFAPNDGAERWIDDRVRTLLAAGYSPAAIGRDLAEVIALGLGTGGWRQLP